MNVFDHFWQTHTHTPIFHSVSDLQSFFYHFTTWSHVHSNSFQMILGSHFGFPLQQQNGSGRVSSFRGLWIPDLSVLPSSQGCCHCWTVTVVPTRGTATSMWSSWVTLLSSATWAWGRSTHHPDPLEPRGERDAVLLNYMTYSSILCFLGDSEHHGTLTSAGT